MLGACISNNNNSTNNTAANATKAATVAASASAAGSAAVGTATAAGSAKPASPAASAAAAASPAGSPAAAAGGEALKIGLVTDVGKIDDKSFNQSAWEAVQQAKKDLGAEVKFIEPTDPKDYAKNIDQFATDNYDVIVTVGFGLGDAAVAAAKQHP